MSVLRPAGITVLLAMTAYQAASAADCAERLEAVRTMQAETAYLDPNRPDLVQLRRVARQMLDRGRETLCLDLAKELEALIKDHREHIDEVNALANYATAVPVGEYQGTVTSERLVDMVVRNTVGKELGEVKGLEISANEGRIEAINVVHGGFLGLGEKTVRVPWSQVRLSLDGSAIVLNMSEEQIEELPAAE